ncbi:hypothetical protein [Parasediminibacterium sp. JCM 36343]|uniref:hypothetical protein n=1 Tax=Parasediminibacterium sp. JCM 36343 TaxID=3374279 RepID=UPI003977FCD1
MKSIKTLQALSFILAVLVLSMASCSKTNYVPIAPATDSTAYTGATLLPVKAGNKWVYKDSVFKSANVVDSTFADTAVITAKTATSSSLQGITFYNFCDSIGWFGKNAYLAPAIDQTSGYIFQMDSANGLPYTLFQTATIDNQYLGKSNDFTTPTCIHVFLQYGFATKTVVNGFSCIRNITYYSDCSSTEVIVQYVSPGVGIVRIEDYEKTSSTNSTLYLSYSQTLQKFIPKT